MYKLIISAALLIIAVPAVAKTYTFTKNGSSFVVTPSLFKLSIKPWPQEPKPDCKALFKTLYDNRRLIDRCLPSENQPATACALLEKSMTRAILGTEDAVGPMAEDVEQFFNVQSVSFEPIPDIAQIARDEGIPLRSLVKKTTSPWEQAISQLDVSFSAGPESWIPKLIQLPYFKDLLGNIQVGTDHSFGVRDRLSYCEVANGKSGLRGEVLYSSAGAATSISDTHLEWLEGLYEHLKTLRFPLTGTLDQQALTIGFEMGSYILEHPLPAGVEFDAIGVYKLFFLNRDQKLTLNSLDPSMIKSGLSRPLEYQIKSPFQTTPIED
jgi:hypothetical protein